jgi:hypothetical protein
MKTKLPHVASAFVLGLALATGADLCAQDTAKTQDAPPVDDAAELAKKLSNPAAALISVPFQNNFEFGGGPKNDGFRYTLNFQPVIPRRNLGQPQIWRDGYGAREL